MTWMQSPSKCWGGGQWWFAEVVPTLAATVRAKAAVVRHSFFNIKSAPFMSLVFSEPYSGSGLKLFEWTGC
jgi:hypothetical protein